MFASYAALDLAGRVTAAGGWTRAVWLLGGAGAMGTGIWSMHYIGMLAFILPIPVAYHCPTVLLSLLAAIVASVVALYVVSRQKMGMSRAIAGSVLMGAGIASMHYIGMDAMRLPAICRSDSSLVVLSVVFAVLISFAALWITFHFRDGKTGIGREKLAGAVVMGADPRHALHRHGRRQFHALRHASGSVSRRKRLHAWHRRNCRRHLYRARAGSADVLDGQAIGCPYLGARGQALAQLDRGAAAAGLGSHAGRRDRLLQHPMDRIHGGTGSRPARLALDGGAAPGRPGKCPASLGRCGGGTPAL